MGFLVIATVNLVMSVPEKELGKSVNFDEIMTKIWWFTF